MKKSKKALIFYAVSHVLASASATVFEPSIDLEPFLRRIELSEECIGHFFTCYNDPLYSEYILPRCSVHLMDLLGYAQAQENPYSFAYTILELFHVKFKECRYLNAAALAQMFDKLPALVGNLYVPRQDTPEAIFQYLLSRLSAPGGFHLAQEEAIPFAQQLSEDLYERCIQPASADRDLKQLTQRFLESVLNKAMWSPHDGIGAWKFFKLLGHQLESLYNNHMIHDVDTLNHMIWSLVYRFCYFIELSGSALPVSCYIEMEHDVAQGIPDFLNYDDNDKLMRPKADVLAKALIVGRAKSLAYAKDILTDTVI